MIDQQEQPTTLETEARLDNVILRIEEVRTSYVKVKSIKHLIKNSVGSTICFIVYVGTDNINYTSNVGMRSLKLRDIEKRRKVLHQMDVGSAGVSGKQKSNQPKTVKLWESRFVDILIVEVFLGIFRQLL